METKAVVYKTWDDLVFDKRNKEYGAYALRKSYNNQVLLGFGLSIAMISLLFLIPHNGVTPKPVIDHTLGKHTLEINPQIFEVKPPRRKRITPPQQPRPEVRHASIIPIVTTEVVNQPADEAIAEPEPEFVDDNGADDGMEGGSDTGTGGSTMLPVDSNATFVVVETPPVYKGGVEAMVHFLNRNLKYPNAARRLAQEGTVYVSFVVKRDSTVTDVQVLRGFHPDCDKEAMRVVAAMPDWISGMQSKMPVNVRMVLPVKFVLRD